MKWLKYAGLPVLGIAAYVFFSLYVYVLVPGGGVVLCTVLTDSLCAAAAGAAYFFWIRRMNANQIAGCPSLLGQREVVWLYVLLIPLWFLTQSAVLYIMENISSAGISSYSEAIDASPELYLALTLFIAPVFEELLFRGVTLSCFLRIMPWPAAYLLSALLFGAIHGTLPHLWLAMVMGLAFGAIYRRTGKLRYNIAAHSFSNALSIVLAGFGVPAALCLPAVFLPLTALCLLPFYRAARWCERTVWLRPEKETPAA